MVKIPAVITLSGHELELVEQYAGVNFSPKQIARLLQKPYALIKAAITDKNSLVYEAYHRGILTAKLIIAEQLAIKVAKGSMTAIQQEDKVRQALEFENIKTEIFDL